MLELLREVMETIFGWVEVSYFYGLIGIPVVVVLAAAVMRAHDVVYQPVQSKAWLSADNAGAMAFCTLMGSMVWPAVVLIAAGLAAWGLLVFTISLPIRLRKRRTDAAAARTPEALAKRARRVRSDIDARLAEIEADPLSDFEADQLRAAREALRTAEAMQA